MILIIRPHALISDALGYALACMPTICILDVCTCILIYRSIIYESECMNIIKEVFKIWWSHIIRYRYPITTITSYTQAAQALQDADENTFIFFDIDDTLSNPVDPLGELSLIPWWFRIQALLKYPRLLLRKNLIHYLSIIWKEDQWLVIEPLVVDIINNLKDRGAKVMILSLEESAKFGVIKHLPEWRYDVLKSLGVIMSQNYANGLIAHVPKYNGKLPRLYNGIISCNNDSKGQVLEAFLKQYRLRPSKIIFFEDQIHNLVSVAQACAKLNIPFQGFQYLGEIWQLYNWNETCAQWQLDQLIKHDTWHTTADYKRQIR